ncbi:hypothetical protein [Methanospirillum hungatei]|nr:hypothetical protein [Methanospirillum hungatei]
MPHTNENGIDLNHSGSVKKIRSSSGIWYPQYSYPRELRRGIYC